MKDPHLAWGFFMVILVAIELVTGGVNSPSAVYVFYAWPRSIALAIDEQDVSEVQALSVLPEMIFIIVKPPRNRGGFFG
jgi:hypothetical protein